MMRDMEDLDNLMDNFDLHTFWEKKKLSQVLGIYLAYVGVGTIFLIKAILDEAKAGAVPKGMAVDSSESKSFVR